MSGFQDVLEDDKIRQQYMADFNPGKYRGVIDHIGKIRDNIERDREVYTENEQVLKDQIKKSEVVAKVVQKNLSQQIELTNRG